MTLRVALAVCISLALQGCTVLATVVGGSASTVQVAQTVDAAKLGADAVSGAATGKTITDHAISYVFNQDCTLFNVFSTSKPVCRDYDEPLPVEPTPEAAPVININPVTHTRTTVARQDTAVISP
jgi:hypothetical protein